MKLPKLVTLFLAWALLALVLLRFVPALGDIIELRTLLFVVGIAPVYGLAVLGAADVFGALRAGLGLGGADVPPETRARYSGALRMLGDLSLAAGVFAFFATVIATFNAMAMAGGNASAVQVLGGASTTFLAPLYGFLLRSFVYGPMASGLAEPGSWLGSELEG